MGRENPRAGVVEDRRLDLAAEQCLGIAGEELVERVVAAHQHPETVAAPACATPLLAQRGDCAGKADRDGAVEEADVDPELEGICGGDTEQLALDEPAFDLATLLRRVAGAVGGQTPGDARVDPRSGE